jgi:hypothetical protein
VKRRGVVVLLLLGLVFTLMGAVPLIQALPVLLYAKRALATVETVEQLADAKRYRVRVAFETMEGQKTRAEVDLADQQRVRRLVRGDQVELFYAVGDPQRVELYTPQVFWVRGWWYLVPGIFMLWLGWQAMRPAV